MNLYNVSFFGDVITLSFLTSSFLNSEVKPSPMDDDTESVLTS